MKRYLGATVYLLRNRFVVLVWLWLAYRYGESCKRGIIFLSEQKKGEENLKREVFIGGYPLTVIM